MALSQTRVVSVGETPYAHEKEAIAFAISELPDTDPYHLWALIDLLDRGTGRLHEIDLLIMGYSAIYLVEVKSGPGLYQGDDQDWWWTPPGGRPKYRDNPRKLTRRKAQILKSHLERQLPRGVRSPWIEPLVFLSNPDTTLNLTRDGIVGVVTRDNFAKAITHNEIPGRNDARPAQRIDRKVMREVIKGLEVLGFKARKGKLYAGQYELAEVLDETDSYQDRLARHREIASQTRRARIYLVPEQTSVERRQQLKRAADREAQLLYEVREHPHVLDYIDYVTDAPLGPTVFLDAFDGGIPLDAFLRQHPDLPFGDRIAVLDQVGRALDFCHKKQVVHAALSPASILVRRHPDTGDIEARLFNFQLGHGGEVTGTTHWSALAEEAWVLYQAPELRDDPSQRTPQADLFSLGAVAFHLLTGRPPAADLVELVATIGQRRCLDPRTVDDAVPEPIAELVGLATHEVLASRADDVGEWLALLLDVATAPERESEPEQSPLEAKKDDWVAGFLVHGFLGNGATSRVIEVERDDGRRFALKVSIGPDHDERLAAEAAELRKLRHPRVVQLEDELEIAGRACLLLSLAGPRTLLRELAAEGTVSLDYGSRWGEDLLSALEHLEDAEVIHRDIKPPNVGVGAVQKKAKHLTLFDFSLAGTHSSDLAVGTAAYRDPFLPDRGAWDHAADRWSAAVTLHELLTGQRPQVQATEDGARQVVLSAERFDPAVRDKLLAFFTRAFAAAAADRFADAKTMRREWEHVFEKRAEPGAEARAPEALTDDEVRAVEPDTPIAALPLTVRARNALDRAGLVRARDLVTLPDNRLSGIRGIGSRVAREIHDFRRRWAALRPVEATAGPAFFPGYRGEALIVHTALDPATAAMLADAGLTTLAQVAAAPAAHITALAERHGLDAAAVRAALDAENRRADEREHPSTLEGWEAALLPAKRKRDRNVRALFGLDEPLAGKLGLAPREAATALSLTAANIYISLGKAKDDWQDHPALHALVELVRALVEDAGGALALEATADRLLERLPHDRADEAARLRAAALVRVVAEVDKDADDGLRFVRFVDDSPWLFSADDRVAAVRALGKKADELAGRAILAGPEETARMLSETVSGTPLSGVGTDRLVRLAAAASRTAACSSRLELYPRGMPARRALELSATVLAGNMSPEDIRARVGARYPQSEALPPRPELDTLLEPYKLQFEPSSSSYLRPEEGGTSRHTSIASITSWTRMTATAPEIDAAEVASAEFEDKIKACLERRSLLVLGVTADRAPEAARALADRFGLVPRSFDALFLAELRKQMAVKKVQPEVVYAADAAGPGGSAWGNIMRLASLTAKTVAAELLPPREPLLLTDPGLIDRYQLTDFLRALLEKAGDDRAEATLVLVPGHGDGAPAIGGRTVIPGLLPGQFAKLSRTWLAKQKKRAA